MSKMLFTASAAGLLIAFGGGPASDSSDGAMFRANLQRTGVYFSESVRELTQLLWKFQAGGGIISSPAIADGTVYFGSNDGYLYALDIVTGKEKWKFGTGSAVRSSPAVGNKVVYIGSADGNLYAVATKTGQEKWKFKTAGTIASSPAITDGVVYIGSYDGHLYAVNIKTGEEKWKFKTGRGIKSSPARADVPPSPHDSPELNPFVYSSPAIADGVVYFGSGDRYLYAVDIQTGVEKWKFQSGDKIFSSPAVADGVVYFHSEEYLYAVDSQTGQKKWVFEAPGEILRSPAITNGVGFIGSKLARVRRRGLLEYRAAYLYAINIFVGQEKWKYELESDDKMTSPPAIAGDVVYFGVERHLYAVDIQTGVRLWQFQTEGDVFTSPAIVDGVVYFGDDEGCLYAVR